MNIAVVVGSSRKKGNTEKISSLLSEKLSAKLYNLSDYEVKPFDYSFNNQNDDFLSLISEVVANDVIFLASPVYWYSPSSQMKTFMDRFSDLLKINKPLGRQLRRKFVGIIATGCDESPKSCFEDIFKNTFNHLGMNYIGMLYISISKDEIDYSIANKKVDDFCTLSSINMKGF